MYESGKRKTGCTHKFLSAALMPQDNGVTPREF